MEELEAVLEDGMGFDGSSIDGFAHMTRHAIHTARSALCWQPALIIGCAGVNRMRTFRTGDGIIPPGIGMRPMPLAIVISTI